MTNTAIDSVKAYETSSYVSKDNRKEISSVKVTATTAFDETALVAAATIIKANQYGVEASFTTAEIASITLSAVSGKATFVDNGKKSAKVVTAEAGAVVKATVTTANGKTVVLDVKFDNAVVKLAATVPTSTGVTSTDGTEFTVTFGTAVAATDTVEVSFVPTGSTTAQTAVVTGTGTSLTATFGTVIEASGTVTVKTTVPATATIAAGTETKSFDLTYDADALGTPPAPTWVLVPTP